MSDQLERQFNFAEEGLRRSNSLSPEQAAEARRAGAFDSHPGARDDDDDDKGGYGAHGPNRSQDAEEVTPVDETNQRRLKAEQETVPGEAVLSWGGGEPVSHPSGPGSKPVSAAGERTAGVSGREIPPSKAEPSLDEIRRRQRQLDAQAYAERTAGSYFHQMPVLHSQATDIVSVGPGGPPVPVGNFSEGHLSGVDAIVAATETRSRR